jgi:hypothetical protein
MLATNQTGGDIAPSRQLRVSGHVAEESRAAKWKMPEITGREDEAKLDASFLHANLNQHAVQRSAQPATTIPTQIAGLEKVGCAGGGADADVDDDAPGAAAASSFFSSDDTGKAFR